jgi:hypothetical protein
MVDADRGGRVVVGIYPVAALFLAPEVSGSVDWFLHVMEPGRAKIKESVLPRGGTLSVFWRFPFLQPIT